MCKPLYVLWVRETSYTNAQSCCWLQITLHNKITSPSNLWVPIIADTFWVKLIYLELFSKYEYYGGLENQHSLSTGPSWKQTVDFGVEWLTHLLKVFWPWGNNKIQSICFFGWQRKIAYLPSSDKILGQVTANQQLF